MISQPGQPDRERGHRVVITRTPLRFHADRGHLALRKHLVVVVAVEGQIDDLDLRLMPDAGPDGLGRLVLVGELPSL